MSTLQIIAMRIDYCENGKLRKIKKAYEDDCEMQDHHGSAMLTFQL